MEYKALYSMTPAYLFHYIYSFPLHFILHPYKMNSTLHSATQLPHYTMIIYLYVYLFISGDQDLSIFSILYPSA